MQYLEHVKINTVLERQTSRSGLGFGVTKTWVEVPFPETVATCIGFRTLHNGKVHYYGEEGNEFSHTGSIKAALMVYHPRRKPVLVPL